MVGVRAGLPWALVTGEFDLNGVLLTPGTQKFIQRRAVSFQDEPVGGNDASQGPILADLQDERVIQATRPLKHCPPAAAPAQDRNVSGFAGVGIDLGGNAVGVADDDEVRLRFPKAQNLLAVLVFTEIEQHFIARQIFRGRWQGQVQIFHL